MGHLFQWRFKAILVCAGRSGPGNLYLINGLYDAYRSRVPVLAIATHIPSREIGGGYFQETHPEHLFRECRHFCYMLSHPARMPRRMAEAAGLPGLTAEQPERGRPLLIQAVNHHGPALLNVPVNR